MNRLSLYPGVFTFNYYTMNLLIMYTYNMIVDRGIL